MKADIDLTSLFGLAQALETDQPSVWARRSYYDVSLTLLLADGARVPAPRSAKRSSRGIVYPVQDALASSEFDPQHVNSARKAYVNQAKDDCEAIAEKLQRLKQAPEYIPWIEWHVRNEWKEHVENFEDRFVEHEHIPAISAILRLRAKEVLEADRQLVELAKNPHLLSKTHDSILDVSTADAAVRGFYYDELSRLSGNRKILLHPVRRRILKGGKGAIKFGVDDVARNLVVIIGNSAFENRFRGKDETIGFWTEALKKCRRRYPEQRREGRDPRDTAVAIAKEAGIVRHFHWARPWIKSMDIAAGYVTEFVIDRHYPGNEGIGFGLAAAAFEIVDECATFGVHCIEKSNWAVSRLATSGRLFSFEEAAMLD